MDVPKGANEVPGRPATNIKITPGVVYGQGRITKDDKEATRDLWMDVYEPADAAEHPRAAVILTFGGSFHRGGPRETFYEDGAHDTPMSDYGRTLAARGYVCFTIDYRLAPEHPIPDRDAHDAAALDDDSMENPLLIAQVNKVRSEMGLPPIEADRPRLLPDAILSAAEDLREAINFVRASADVFAVDPHRIALGGFSAGAATTLNVAYGMGVPVSAVFTLSGGIGGYDIPATLVASPDNPPILLIQGQHDLEGILQSTPVLLRHLQAIDLPHSLVWVPGFGHFYPSGAPTLAADGTRASVDERIVQFLADTIQVPPQPI